MKNTIKVFPDSPTSPVVRVEPTAKELEISTLKRFADASLTIDALDRVANAARELGLFKYVREDIGRNNSRLMGKQFTKPSVYVNRETGTAKLVSYGTVVGEPSVTVQDLCNSGYRFKRVVSG